MGAGAMNPHAGQKVEQKISLPWVGFLCSFLPVKHATVRAAYAARLPAGTQGSAALDTAG